MTMTMTMTSRAGAAQPRQRGLPRCGVAGRATRILWGHRSM